MSSFTYPIFPRITIGWTNVSNLSYVVVSWTGNTAATSGSYSSGNIFIPTTSYTTGDLSFNTLYNFKVVPYNNTQTSGSPSYMNVDTTFASSNIYSTSYTSSTAQIQWKNPYSYVKITRKIGSLETAAAVDISSVVFSNYYTDYDLSGNTNYTYSVTTYEGTYPSGTVTSTTNDVTIKTAVQSPSNLAVSFYDTSAIVLSFTPAKNSYSQNMYYTCFATDNQNNTVITNGTKSPMVIQNLSGGTMYTCYLRVTLDYSNNLVATSNSVTQMTLSSISTLSSTVGFALIQGGDVSYNFKYVDPYDSNNYSYFVIKDTTASPVNIKFYNVNSGVNAYYLAVAGGSGGGNNTNGAGGGGGEVLQGQAQLFPNQELNATVGLGGAIQGWGNYLGRTGYNTKLTGAVNVLSRCSNNGLENFTSNVSNSGSGYTGGKQNYGNYGPGGAGAGGVGGDTPIYPGVAGGAGGPGVQYSYYGFPRYWFGGGGGGGFIGSTTYATYAGSGGIGGGGAGFGNYTNVPLKNVFSGSGDKNSIYPSINANDLSNNSASNGAPNSGGGGGGGAYNGVGNSAGSGGSGVAMIAIQQNILGLVDDMSGIQFYYKFDSGDYLNNGFLNYANNTYDAIAANYGSSITASTSLYKIGSGSAYCAAPNNGLGYITLPNLPANRNGYTFTFWFYSVNPTGSNVNNLFMLYNSSSSSNGRVHSYIDNSTGKFYVGTTAGTDFTPFTVTANTWYHIVWILTTSGVSTVHVNGGNFNGGTTYTNANTGYVSVTFSSQYSSMFGDSQAGFYRAFYGYLDDFRYYDRILDKTTVSLIYNQKNYTTYVNYLSATLTSTSPNTIKLTFSASGTKYVIIKNITTNAFIGPYVLASNTNTVYLTGFEGLKTYQFVVYPFDTLGMQGTPSPIVSCSISTGINFVDDLNNLVFYYKFDQGDIVNNKLFNYAQGVYDASLNPSNNLPAINPDNYKTGNGSIRFNEKTPTGTNIFQYLKMNQTFYTGATGLSMSFWVCDVSYGQLFDFALNNGTTITHLKRLVDAQNDEFYIQAFNTNTTWLRFKRGEWYHIALTISNYDGANGATRTLYLYVNGVLTFNTSTTVGYSNGFLNNMYLSNTATCYFDDFRFFNGVSLNQTQVNKIYSDASATSFITSASITVLNDNSVSISWTATGASYYLIYICNKDVNSSQVGLLYKQIKPVLYGLDNSITSSPYVISGLSFGTNYNFFVIPYDSSLRQGIASQILSATTNLNYNILSNAIVYFNSANPNSYPAYNLYGKTFSSGANINYGYYYFDLTGNNNHMCLKMYPSSSYLNGQMYFDNLQQYGRFTLDGGTTLSTLNNFNSNNMTIIFWVYFNTYTAWNGNFGGSSGTRLMTMSRSSSNVLNQFIFYVDAFCDYDNVSTWSYVRATTPPPSYKWCMISFVKNGTTGTFYLNGNRNGTGTLSQGISYNPTNVFIGVDGKDMALNNLNALWGLFGSFAMYNVSLSDSQMMDYYNATKHNYLYNDYYYFLNSSYRLQAQSSS